LMVLGSTVLMVFRDRISQALQAALLWLVIAMVLAAAYAYRVEFRELADHMLAELVPGHGVQIGRTVEIARGRRGEFQVFTEVNGAPVAMVLDSGASAVVLTHQAAKAAGLPLEVLAFTVDIDTANGRGRAASVMLDRVAVGSIVERSVPALIAQSGQLKESLLGMSFLNRLEGWEVRGDKLLMRGPH
jgi:aspartyl protease family protein